MNNLIEKRRKPLSERRARRIFAQIARVAYDFQKAGICHRDLKDENVLVAPGDKIYMIDFGTTMDVESSYSDMVGTPCFFSPEFFTQGFFRPQQLSVWSIGAILYIMMVRHWRWANEAEEWRRDSRDESKLSEPTLSFINQLLEEDADKRLTLLEVLESDWLKA